MIKRVTHSISSSAWQYLCIITFLLLFVNVSVVQQYFDISNEAGIELCEEEEGGKEGKDKEGKGKEGKEKEGKEIIGFHGFGETVITSIDIKNNVQNSQLILDCYIEVFTPPPEFIS